jgi:hypothetical protein
MGAQILSISRLEPAVALENEKNKKKKKSKDRYDVSIQSNINSVTNLQFART